MRWALAASLSISSAAFAADLHVPANFATIQDAINAAVNGDTVIVAPGTYTGVGNREITTLGKAITVRSSGGAAATIIDCQGSSSQPRRGFSLVSASPALLIDGFTIRNGYQTLGGGVRVTNSSSTLRNLIVTNCTSTSAGGGIYITGSGTPSLNFVTVSGCTGSIGGGIADTGTGIASYTDCTISSCTSAVGGGGGGGLYVSVGPATLTRVDITDNQSLQNEGGGLAVRNSGSVTMTGGSVSRNHTVAPTGFMGGDGGGIACLDSGSNVSLSGVTVADNIVDWGSGGGVWLRFGAAGTFSNCTVTGNRNGNGGQGGGIGVWDTNPANTVVIADSIISSNTSTGEGGGIMVRFGTSPVRIERCTIGNNTAAGQGGGICLWDRPITTQITDCTIEDNTGGNEGGGIMARFGLTAQITNCIIRRNTITYSGGGVCVWDQPVVTMSGCTVADNRSLQGNGGGVWCAIASLTVSGGSVTGNQAQNFGAGMCFENATAVVGNVLSENNSSPNWGGAGVTTLGGTMRMNACTIRGNSTNEGGGVWTSGVDDQFTDCVIENNNAVNNGGGVSSNQHNAFPATFLRCTIRNNTARSHAGLSAVGSSKFELTDCHITGNTATDVNGGGGGLGAIHCARVRMTGGSVAFNDTAGRAGGVWLDDNGACPSSLEFINVQVTDNTAEGSGGAVLIGGSDLVPMTFTNCTFTNNTTLLPGSEGGAFIVYSPVSLTGCTLSGNSSVNGGAICAIGFGKPTLTNCTVSQNIASNQGGGVYARDSASVAIAGGVISNNIAGWSGGGLGIYVNGFIPTTHVIQNCTVQGNSATYGGGLNLSSDLVASITVRDCSILDNVADNEGGGMDCGNGTPLLERCTIAGNYAGGAGGVFCAGSGSPTLRSCIIRGNSCDGEGGGYYSRNGSVGKLHNCLITDNYAAGKGGGVMIYDGGSVGSEVVHCTIARNDSVGTRGVDIYSTAPVRVVNSIIRDNGPSRNFSAGPNPEYASYCNIQGGAPGAGNIDAPAFFTDPDGADNIPGTSDDDFSLAAGSWCIDAADVTQTPTDLTTDLGGQPRRHDDPGIADSGLGTAPLSDMGAYEFQGDSTCALLDFNHDGFVTGDDFDAYVAAFETGDPAADFNRDGFVSGDDFDAYVAAFETGC